MDSAFWSMPERFTCLPGFVEVHYLMSAAIGSSGLTTIYIVASTLGLLKTQAEKTRMRFYFFNDRDWGLGINELGIFADRKDDVFIHGLQILVTALVFMWNFGVRKLLLFR